MTVPAYLEPLNKTAALEKQAEINKTKRCTKCGELKSIESFSRKKGSPDGRRPQCKSCDKKYYDAHVEEILRKKHESYDPESKSAYNKIYVSNNRDRLRESGRIYDATHKEEKRTYNQKYRIENKEKIADQKFGKRVDTIQTEMFKHAKRRAEKSGFPFSITENDIPVPDFCPVLGIPIKVGKGKLHANSPTIDRLTPELGYVPGNVCVISHRANSIKSNGTVEEHRIIADWMEKRLAEREARKPL